MPRSLSAQGPTPKPSPRLAVIPDSGYLIPPHVMGRNLENPTEDLIGDGRRMQRPRLGVRVPYRNLTSQIVTQDEIAQEILQRSLRRNTIQNTIQNNTGVKDVFFAMKLSQRLAHRLTNTGKQENEESTQTERGKSVPQDPPLKENQTSTSNDKFNPPSKMDPALERELALKQLNELPSLKKPRRRRSEPGPADHLIIKRVFKPPAKLIQRSTKRKFYTRKQKRVEVDQGIQAGPGELGKLKVTVKRKSIIVSAPTVSTAKKAKVDSSAKPLPMVNGTSRIALVKQEENEEGTSTENISPKRRSKQHRELDMLLGDEGAVNMIYEAEHGQKKAEAKVPRKNSKDMQLKARLVKNAVLRLSSALPTSSSRSRGRRKSTPPTSPPSVAVSEPRSPLQTFSFPPKLAEQSRIIRRHSSDSDFSNRSRSTSPKMQDLNEPLTIIPGPRKKKGVPIFVKKVERTYKGKKKLGPPVTLPVAAASVAVATEAASTTVTTEEKKTPKQYPGPRSTQKRSPSLTADQKKVKISSLVKNKLTDEMSRNFQQVLNAQASAHAAALETNTSPEMLTSATTQASTSAHIKVSTSAPTQASTSASPQASTSASPQASTSTSPQQKRTGVNVPNRRRKQELESRPYDDTKIILGPYDDDDDVLRTLEAQLAAVVGESLDSPQLPSTPPPTVLDSSSTIDQPDLYAPSTSSGGVMKSSPSAASTSSSPNSKPRQSVRQSAGTYNFREINLRRYSNLVQIILTPVSTKMKNALNVQVLKELREALTQLKRDDGCHVVLLSSTGSSFCQGIDVHSLIHTALEKRKKAAQELSNALKDFLKTLAHFSKPLAAAVHGPAVGLGVTMLPFFDMVFASDNATFYAPYAKLGQVPEGAVALTMSTFPGYTLSSELLYCCRKLTATEAQRSGLVTRILWPDRFQEELIPTLSTIAWQSSQSMEGSKLLLRESLRSRLDAALETESQLLIQHWCSTECQNAFRALLDMEGVGIQKQRPDPASSV